MNKAKSNTKVNLNAFKDHPILSKLIDDLNKKMQSALSRYTEELMGFQVSKINLGYLGNLALIGDNSGKLSHIASLSLDNRTFSITVHDKSKVPAIIKTIEQVRKLTASLGNEKNIVKVTIPDPTEERRAQVAKEVKESAKHYGDQINGIRRDAISSIDKEGKKKVISEDELKLAKNIVEQVKDNVLNEISSLCAKQEGDIKRGKK